MDYKGRWIYTHCTYNNNKGDVSMKASDLFLRCLEAQGVTDIYGVPGEENADLMISLLDSKINFHVTRHEQTASFMADMHGRLTGKPGVCLCTLGPGATNMITGVANANMDHAPLIAIVGQASTTRLHKESHQNMNSVMMYTPVTKWATTIRDAEVIPEVIQKAFKLAREGKPGAVMIELPEDVAKIDVDVTPIKPEKTDYESGVASHNIEKTLELIAKSKTPILLIGAGATRNACDEKIKAFMEHTGIYAAVTFMGKGSISARHPQSLYCVGLGVKDIAIEAFDQTDLVICIGYDMVEWHPDRWNEGHKKKIIHIDVMPAEVDKNYIPMVELVGNINSTLDQINNQLNKAHKKDTKQFAKIRERITEDLSFYADDQAFPIKPQRILSDLRDVMRDDDILISDVGAHKMWVARHYQTYVSKSCFIYNGFCSMGGSLPGAVEAKRLNPDKNVVALCGDGGFVMSIQALATAVRLKTPIVVVLWEDDYYGLIKWKQEAAYHKYSHVNLVNPDLVKLAEGFGCNATRINDVEELKDKLNKAFTEKDVPTVVVVPVDYAENMKLNKRLSEIISH